MNKRILVGVVLVIGIFACVWRLYFPYIFDRICWLPQDQYAKTIHVVSLGSDSNGQINPVSTTSSANTYYCARFGAAPLPDLIPSTPPYLVP